MTGGCDVTSRNKPAACDAIKAAVAVVQQQTSGAPIKERKRARRTREIPEVAVDAHSLLCSARYSSDYPTRKSSPRRFGLWRRRSRAHVFMIKREMTTYTRVRREALSVAR